MATKADERGDSSPWPYHYYWYGQVLRKSEVLVGPAKQLQLKQNFALQVSTNHLQYLFRSFFKMESVKSRSRLISMPFILATYIAGQEPGVLTLGKKQTYQILGSINKIDTIIMKFWKMLMKQLFVSKKTFN